MRTLTAHYAGRLSPLLRVVFVVGAIALALPFSAARGQTQSCVNCTLYARTELNLREQPDVNAKVLRFVPAGAGVHRDAGKDVDSYAPVTYQGTSGWVVALGLVTSPDQIDASEPATTPTTTPAPANDDVRVTLEPLMLRSGPSIDDDPILVMPQGATMTLTREGAANGYVTVDFDGTVGWVFADLIARPSELP
jgi:uncharacterized protein YgiM (DUF1202 family)